MSEHAGVARAIVADLPVNDEEADEELIALHDIMITGIEVTEWTHWRIRLYSPEADGSEEHPWAVLQRLPEAEMGPRAIKITADGVRKATEAYLTNRLEGGMSLSEARKLVDGVYTDAVIADSILQYAVYGQEIFN